MNLFLDIPLREQQLSNTGNTATLEVNFDEVEPFANSEGLTTTTVPQDNVAAQRVSQIKRTLPSWSRPLRLCDSTSVKSKDPRTRRGNADK